VGHHDAQQVQLSLPHTSLLLLGCLVRFHHDTSVKEGAAAGHAHGFKLSVLTAAAAAAAASWSLLCRRHEDMSARLLEYAVDQQCIDISRQQLQLIHRIISGSSSNGSSTMCNSSSSSQQWDCSDAPWMLQVRVMRCVVVVVVGAHVVPLLHDVHTIMYRLCRLLMH
jgi:hypothetical protein